MEEEKAKEWLTGPAPRLGTEPVVAAPIRAALFLVRSEAQLAAGADVAAELELCRVFIATQGWRPHGLFIDEGVGPPAKRPAVNQLWALVREQRVDVVVVARLDRPAQRHEVDDAVWGVEQLAPGCFPVGAPVPSTSGDATQRSRQVRVAVSVFDVTSGRAVPPTGDILDGSAPLGKRGSTSAG